MCRAPGSFFGNTGDVGKAQRTGFSRAGSTESLGYRESRVSEGNKGRETEELISRCCCLLVQRDGSVLGRSADPSEWFCDRERSPTCESSTLKQTAGRESEGNLSQD